MRGKWIKFPRSYDSGYCPHAAEIEKLVLWYHQGKISKKAFDRLMTELLGEKKE